MSIVNIPIIASGGGGNARHFVDLFKETDVSAGLAASIFHDEQVSIAEVKEACAKEGVAIRNV
jgi:cyclase